jgi:nucleotide-binding universal stress UspA family protein
MIEERLMPKAFRGAVAILDDGSAAAADILDRIGGVFPSLHQVTHSQVEASPATVVRVSRRKLHLRTLLDKMRDAGIYVAFVRQAADPVQFCADYLTGAYEHLAAGYPAFMVVSSRQGIDRYRRLAVIADVRRPVKTGVAAMAGEGLAHWTGADLDFLVLGVPPDAHDKFIEDPTSFFTISDEAELLKAAAERARAMGLQPRWVPLGTGKPDEELVLEAVREHGYDLVIDHFRPIDIGARIGRNRRITDQLTGDKGGTALRLLTDAPCDVAIIVDAVDMRLIPADRVGTAAGFALSLGLFAGPSASKPYTAPMEARITAEGPLVPGAEAAEAVEQSGRLGSGEGDVGDRREGS